MDISDLTAAAQAAAQAGNERRIAEVERKRPRLEEVEKESRRPLSLPIIPNERGILRPAKSRLTKP